jgi:NAD(P)-dependent dehydrogenase (short-subunit alcohol dehydrogenase family)
MALKLAKYCVDPEIYIVGRSQESASEVLSSLKAINPAGKYEFRQFVVRPHALRAESLPRCDVSLLANVKALASKLREELPTVNYLVLSSGILSMAGRSDTTEGIDVKMA